jgi:oxygen-dependent protoporphyrinogen oxidase
VVSAHRLDEFEHPLDAYGLVIPARERRLILAVSFLSRKFRDRAPPHHVVLRTFIGGALQPEMCERTDEELVAITREELGQIFGLRGSPKFTRVVRYPRAMPQYHVGHLDRIREIERLTSEIPGLALCGNAYRGVGLPDCIHDGELAAEKMWRLAEG